MGRCGIAMPMDRAMSLAGERLRSGIGGTWLTRMVDQ